MILCGCGLKESVFVEVGLVAHHAPPSRNRGLEPKSRMQDTFVAEKVRRLQKPSAAQASCGTGKLPRDGTLAAWVRSRFRLQAAGQFQDQNLLSGSGQRKTALSDEPLGCFGRSGCGTSDSRNTSLRVANTIFQPAVCTPPLQRLGDR